MTQTGRDRSASLGRGGAPGLSGEGRGALGGREDLRFFDRFLQRHQAEGDLVVDPSSLWDGAGLVGNRIGLRRHLRYERDSGRFTTVLVIVGRDDWSRAREQQDGRWLKNVRSYLEDRLAAYRIAQGPSAPLSGRDLFVSLVGEGGEATGGTLLGLRPGEFVTGLLPNLHVGGHFGLDPEYTVHVHIPGAWHGYREVAGLYADQQLLTLGSHWLDSFSHPALRAPGLYRVHRAEHGALRQMIDPDLGDRYRLRDRVSADGEPVVALEDRAGRAFAFLRLTSTGGLHAGASVPASDEDPGSDPAVGPLGAARTPGVPRERMFTLAEEGALLQRVHFPNVMTGYDVFLGVQGQIGQRLTDPVARLHVDGEGVSLVAMGDGARLDGRAIPAGQHRRLVGDHQLGLGTTSLSFRDLSGVVADGWPYLAEVRRPGGSVHTPFGRCFRIGREPSCLVRLPDQRQNENIHWRSSDVAAVPSGRGVLSRERFFTDSILVASVHAAIDLTREPVLSSAAESCWTYVRRAGTVRALPPRRHARGPGRAALLDGDELLVGNCVFSVRVDPGGDPRAVRAVGEEPGLLSADELAAEIGALFDQGAFDDIDFEDGALETTEPGLSVDRDGRVSGSGRPTPGEDGPELELPDPVELPLPEESDSEGLEPTVTVVDPDSIEAERTQAARAEVVVVEPTAAPGGCSRPARLVLTGWRCAGRVRVGNHAAADVVLPELRPDRPALDDLTVDAVDGALCLRPGRGSATAVHVGVDGAVSFRVERSTQLGPLEVCVQVSTTRAGDIALEPVLDGAMVRGIFTIGLPLLQECSVRVGGSDALARFDGQVVHLQLEERPDGTPVRRMLSEGDTLVVGGAVYRLELD